MSNVCISVMHENPSGYFKFLPETDSFYALRQNCFATAIRRYEYSGLFRGVFPVKVTTATGTCIAC